MVEGREGGDRHTRRAELARGRNVLGGKYRRISSLAAAPATLDADRIMAGRLLSIELGLVFIRGHAMTRYPRTDDVILEHRTVGLVAGQSDIGGTVCVERKTGQL